MMEDYSSEAFEAQYTYSGTDLGAKWQPSATFFRLWAPGADAVSLCLYRSGRAGRRDLVCKTDMSADFRGTWCAMVKGDWNGFYYTYLICRQGRTVECCDPYAVAAGINGQRSMVCDLSGTNPQGWEKDTSPVRSGCYTDYVLYELHVRDLSSLAQSGISHRGKYLGLAETGTKSPAGYPTGLDHIRQLGVTHVHLMPVFDFGSVDESNPKKQYNWGYDPVHFNVPEGSYATNPEDGAVRIRELKQAILTLHRHGLGVVMDVVYNHVYHTFEFSMNRIVPGYFSRENRQGILSNGSGCGNDTASERSMVRKFIVDSVCFWAEEYHIDGFRFDLVGLLDVETIRQIIAAVRRKHPAVMFYGEGWSMNTQPTKENTPLAVQWNAWMLPDFAFFNDTLRDTLRGSLFDPQQLGFLCGAPVPKEHMLRCFQGRTDWSADPRQIVNYISCHDNHTLHDRIALALPQGDEAEVAKRCRLGAAFNLLSMGIPFFQAGEEMLRSKKTTMGRYVENSYRSSDRVNGIKWNQLSHPEAQKTVQFYRGLLSLRKGHELFRLWDSQQVSQRVRLLPDAPEGVPAFLLSGEEETILVAFHPGTEPVILTLPEGKWDVYVWEDSAGDKAITTLQRSVTLGPISAFAAIQSK